MWRDVLNSSSPKLNAAKCLFTDERIGREIEFAEHSLQVEMEIELKPFDNKRKADYQSGECNLDSG